MLYRHIERLLPAAGLKLYVIFLAVVGYREIGIQEVVS